MSTRVTLERATPADLDRYRGISPAFRVESRLEVDVVRDGLGGFVMHEEPVGRPYTKEYAGSDDALSAVAAATAGIFLAVGDAEVVGGAIVAPTSPEVAPLSWPDSAALFDIRVHPDRRGEGIGSLLLDAAADWAREHGARSLLIETQNVNVPACRFYASCGAELAAIDRFAYAADPDLAHEVMLVWRLAL